MLVSEALLPEAAAIPTLVVDGQPEPLRLRRRMARSPVQAARGPVLGAAAAGVGG